MPKLRTDDDIYRARLVYLGPPGYTLPFQLPYSLYGLGAALVAVFAGGAYFLTGSSDAAIWAGCIAVLLTALIVRHVNPDRPARKILRTVATDWRQTQPLPAAQLPSYSTAHIRIRKAIR